MTTLPKRSAKLVVPWTRCVPGLNIFFFPFFCLSALMFVKIVLNELDVFLVQHGSLDRSGV